MKTVVTIICLFFLFNVQAQIKLPSGFKKVEGDTWRDYRFEKNGIMLNSDCDWGQNYNTNESFLTAMLSAFPYLKKTKDGLYWGTIFIDGVHLYRIVIVESKCILTVSSKKDDTIFSEYSKWLLSNIRINRKSGNGYLFEL